MTRSIEGSLCDSWARCFVQRRFTSSTARTCWRRWQQPASTTVYRSIRTRLTLSSTFFFRLSPPPPMTRQRGHGHLPIPRRRPSAGTCCVRYASSYARAAERRASQRHHRKELRRNTESVKISIGVNLGKSIGTVDHSIGRESKGRCRTAEGRPFRHKRQGVLP